MTLYFDTSALVKLIVVEDGSDAAAELWNSGHTAASSMLCYPEGRAALGAARRDRRLTPTGYRRALEEFEELHRELAIVAVDESLARRAGALAEQMELRGYDAVHLTSAIGLGTNGTTLVTWDQRLSRAAAQQGLTVSPA